MDLTAVPESRGNPTIGLHSAKAAKRSAQLRRRLSLAEIELALGPLKTPDDAMARLERLNVWAAGGQIPGAVAHAAVRAIEVWLKAFAEQVDMERVKGLEHRIAELEAELRQAGRRP